MTDSGVLDKETRRRVVETPESPQALLDLGQQAFQRGRLDPAKWFARSLAIAPDEPGLHLAMSVVRSHTKERTQSLRRALALDPTFAQAWLALAAEIDDPEGALRRARSVDANDADVSATLVASLLENGNVAEALEIAEKLCASQPGYAPAWINLGRTAVESGAWAVGLVCTRRALVLAKESAAPAGSRAGTARPHRCPV